MEQTGKRLPLCSDRDEVGWTSTKAVNSEGKWETWDQCSHLFLEQLLLVRPGEELTLQDIQAGTDEVYMGIRRKKDCSLPSQTIQERWNEHFPSAPF